MFPFFSKTFLLLFTLFVWYSQSQENHCVVGENNCLACDNSTSCNSCATGSYLNTTSMNCLVCPFGCRTCTSDISCQSCVGNFNLSLGLCVCQGSTGIRFSTTSCTNCLVPNCIRCARNYEECSNCTEKYSVSEDNRTCVSCDDPQCRICMSNKSICTRCNIGYGRSVISPAAVCLPCTSSLCSDCGNKYNECISCIYGYGVYYSSCVVCKQEGCLRCTLNANLCELCEAPKVRVGSYCVDCTAPNCMKCPDSPENCSFCADFYGFEPNTNNCRSCENANCQLCTANYLTCTTCREKAGIGLSNGECVPCSDPKCTTCRSNSSACSSCIIGYGVRNQACDFCQDLNCRDCFTNYANCTGCKDGFGISSSGCLPCSKNRCTNCPNNYAICSFCENGYGVNAAGDCVKCQNTNCVMCSSNSSICTVCSGSGIGLSSGNCVSCLKANCLECLSNANSCTACGVGYGVSGSNCVVCQKSNCQLCSANSTLCTACADNYGVLNGACVICSVPNCNRCSQNSSSCTRCVEKFGLIGFSCQQCSNSKCIKCDSDVNICTVCENGFGISENNVCELCSDGFGVDSNQRCSPCSQINCLKCSINVNVCELCNGGFGVSGGSCVSCIDNKCSECGEAASICSVCSSGFGVSSGNCVSCPFYCLNCREATVCTQCEDKYFIDNDGFCEICPENCTQCALDLNESLPQCYACSEYYEINTNEPKRCFETCGDSWTENYECDNNKDIPFDGCDNNCEQMEDFNCEIDSDGETKCTYIGDLEIKLEESVFDKNKGNFTIQILIVPPLYEFINLTEDELKEIIRINNTGMIIDNITYDENTKEFTLIGRTNENSTVLENEAFKVILSYNNNTFQSPDLKVTYPEENNESPETPDQIIIDKEIPKLVTEIVPIIKKSTLAMVSFSWINLLLQILSSSPCGAESMISIQANWFILNQVGNNITVPNELFSALQYSNGYNFYFGSVRRLLSTPLNENNLFLNNFNLSFALLLVPIVIVLICYFRLICFKNKYPNLNVGTYEKNDKIKSLFQLVKYFSMSWELLLFGCMISITNFAASTLRFIESEGFFYQKINLIAIFVGLLIYVFVFFKLGVSLHLFKLTLDIFRSKQLVYIYHTIYLAIIISYISAPLFLHSSYYFLLCIPCVGGLFFAFFIRPFHRVSETLRYCINMTLLSTIVFFRTFVEFFIASEINIIPIYLFLIIINLIILPVSQIINFFVIAYNVWTAFNKKNIECTCFEKVAENECFKCFEKHEENEMLHYHEILEKLEIIRNNNIVTSGKQLVSDLDSEEVTIAFGTEKYLEDKSEVNKKAVKKRHTKFAKY